MLAKTVFAYGGGQGSQSLRHIRGQHPTTSPMAALARRRPQIHRAATDPACCPLAAHQRISSRRSTPAGASHNSSSEVGQGGGKGGQTAAHTEPSPCAFGSLGDGSDVRGEGSMD